MFNTLRNRLQRTDQSTNTSDSDLESPEDGMNAEPANGDERPRIRMVDITPKEEQPEVEVVETGFGLIHLLLAGVGGGVLAIIALLSVLILVDPQAVPTTIAMEVIA
jgi:hypothetical protein